MMDENQKALYAAIVAVQAELPAIPKDGTNPHFNSRYITLGSIWEAIRPVLAKHKLAVLQFPTREGLLTQITHESGEVMQSVCPMPTYETAQQFGSALSYVRRYSLSSILGIVSDEDDDGQAASVPATPRAYTSQAAPSGKSEGFERLKAVAERMTGGVGPTVPRGKDKGLPISQLNLNSLGWWMKACKENMDNPDKAKYRDSNTKEYVMFLNEYIRRIGSDLGKLEEEQRRAASAGNDLAAGILSRAINDRFNGPTVADTEAEVEKEDLPF
jgi:hypothetical protein